MKLLILTHTFPPSSHSNAKRPFYVAKAALDAGWEVRVITSDIGISRGEEEALVHPRLRIDRVFDPVIWAMQKTKRFPKLWMRLMNCVNALSWPDYCSGWIKRVLSGHKGTFADYDRVLAFVFPASMLKTGRVPGLVTEKWVFDFQESVSPQYERFPRKSYFQKRWTPKLKELEKKTLHKAGRIIFTARTNQTAYCDAGLVPVSRVEHVPYFYDVEVFRERMEPGPGFVIGYYGNFDASGARNPRVFLQALAKFLEKHPEARSQTRFVFHGTWLAEHDPIVDDLGLRDVSEIGKPVPWMEYISRIRKSPVLLLIVAPEHSLFMPSKIVDYLGAKRPVLAFVPEDSEMREVLCEAGMGRFVCSERNVTEGVLAIERLWQEYLERGLHVDGDLSARWSSSFQTKKYLGILEGDGDGNVVV